MCASGCDPKHPSHELKSSAIISNIFGLSTAISFRINVTFPWLYQFCAVEFWRQSCLKFCILAKTTAGNSFSWCENHPFGIFCNSQVLRAENSDALASPPLWSNALSSTGRFMAGPARRRASRRRRFRRLFDGASRRRSLAYRRSRNGI